jgi:hypothetical protein
MTPTEISQHWINRVWNSAHERAKFHYNEDDPLYLQEVRQQVHSLYFDLAIELHFHVDEEVFQKVVDLVISQ